MGLAGLLAFGVFLDGSDLLLGYLWPDLPNALCIALVTLSVCAGHSLAFHGAEHLQASCNIPFRKTGVMSCELLVVTAWGCLTWAVVIGIVEACYEPTVESEGLFYTMAGEFLGAASWGIALDMYEQSVPVELTASKIFAGYSRDHFAIDFLTKLPSSFVVVWLMDLFIEQLDMSNRSDRFWYNFVYTCCLFVNYVLVAGSLRDMVFKYRDMVPVPSPSAHTVAASCA